MATPQGKPEAGSQPKPNQAAAQSAEGGRRKAIGVREELEEMKELGGFQLWLRDLFHDSPAFGVSLVVHALAVIILFMILIPNPVSEKVAELVSNPNPTEDEPPPEEIEVDLNMAELELQDPIEEAMIESPETEILEQVDILDEPAPTLSVEMAEISNIHAEANIMNEKGKTTGKGLAGRGAASRGAMVAKYGGSAESEAAVAMGLKWLAAHQMQDGGWDFDHGKAPGHKGPVNGPGTEKSRTGATAMALLPFLGAGQTHREGEHKAVVQRGLYFLGSQIKMSANGGDLRGGSSLYNHGLAAIALCEAYALTQDKAIMPHAQASLNYITFAQDKVGGGWRYNPGQPGDTSVVGWQLMALKSGHLAYLVVDKKTIAGAINFLNIVQQEDGAYYGYSSPGKGPATTAIGLLCRMYLGWKHDEPALIRGVEFLAKQGPSKNNMYFNYYATQVMRHFGGEQWDKWNLVMREHLVNTQVKRGSPFEEQGSWTPPKGGHAAEKGGRLYETAMSVMTLEVYYRHMPLYGDEVGQADF
jgi:hypothetical protein